VASSRVTFIGDGVTKQFTVNFALGYETTAQVSCYVGSEATARQLLWLSDNLVTVGGDPAGLGVPVLFKRQTDVSARVVDFKDGNNMTGANLNRALAQPLRAIQEMIDIGIGKPGATGAKGDKGDTGPPGAKGEKGDTGPTGSQGIQGPKGLTGDKGSKGDQGIQGNQGIKGDTGATGATGGLGPKGDTGAQGVQGIPGVKGDTGAQGLKGDTGATGLRGLQGVDGPQGPQGIQGLKGDKGDTGDTGPRGDTGPQGAGVTIKGSVANPGALPASGELGDTYIVTGSGTGFTAGDGYAYTGTGWTNVGQIRGPQGIKGDTGTAGAAGAKGDKGDTGAQGIQGSAGAKGDTGAAGKDGAAGAKGDTGAQGIQGVQGQKGDTGTAGAAGAKGDKGDTGAQGPQGPQGIQGIQGVKGDTGAQGIQGPAGPGISYTPIEQGGIALDGGTGGLYNSKINLGWSPIGLRAYLDTATDLGCLWTDNIMGGAQARNRIKNMAGGSHFVAVVNDDNKGTVYAKLGQGFQWVDLNSTETDAEGLFNQTTHFVNVPLSGLYLITGSFRMTDPTGAFEYGFGVHTDLADGPHMLWDYRPVGAGTRYSAPYSRMVHLTAGQQIRMLFYSDKNGAQNLPIARGAFQVALITAD
jgi:hypothetical protein